MLNRFYPAEVMRLRDPQHRRLHEIVIPRVYQRRCLLVFHTPTPCLSGASIVSLPMPGDLNSASTVDLRLLAGYDAPLETHDMLPVQGIDCSIRSSRQHGLVCQIPSACPHRRLVFVEDGRALDRLSSPLLQRQLALDQLALLGIRMTICATGRSSPFRQRGAGTSSSTLLDLVPASSTSSLSSSSALPAQADLDLRQRGIDLGYPHRRYKQDAVLRAGRKA